MEIMMEMIGFRRLRLKTKQERTLYFSLVEYNDSRKTSFLISLTSQFAVFYFQSSQFAHLRVLFDSSKATLPYACPYFKVKTFHIIARKQHPKHLYWPIGAYFYLIIRINYVIL